MTETVLYALIFASVLLLSDVLLRALRRGRRASTEINRRMTKLGKNNNQREVYQELMAERGLMKTRGYVPLLAALDRLYIHSGVQLTRARRVLYMASLIVVGGVLSTFLLPSIFALQIVFAFFFSGISVVVILWIARNKRQKRFLLQLAPSIDIIVRSLRAGHPLDNAITLVSREMPDPIGTEFGILSDQLTFGASLDDALLAMVDRTGVQDLNLFATTIGIQRSTGGNLAEVLANLANMIRSRLLLRQKVRAISAESRVSSVILLLFPFFLYGLLRFMVPGYFEPLWESGYGGIVVGVGLSLMFVAMLILNRLVNFDF